MEFLWIGNIQFVGNLIAKLAVLETRQAYCSKICKKNAKNFFANWGKS